MVKICYDKLLQPHSVLHYDNKMFYCVSGEFLVKRNEEDIFKYIGYTRGLAIDHFFYPIEQSVDFFLPSRIIQACFCKNRIESKKDQFC